MSELGNKFKTLFIMINIPDAIINCLVVMFSVAYLSPDQEISSVVLGGMAWLFLSFANSIIKEYYETVHLELIFPQNVLIKDIISPAEAMAYYVYFTMSAIFLSSFIGTYTMIISIVVTIFNQYSSKSCRKNPYRFPFSRAILAAGMLFYSAIEYSNTKLFIYPALLAAILTYIFTFLFYSRYYEEVTDNIVKAISAVLILLFIIVSYTLYSKGFFNSEYLSMIMLTNISLLFAFIFVFKGYRKTNIDRIVIFLKVNLIVIVYAVYSGLK